jgi:hypothetical protein
LFTRTRIPQPNGAGTDVAVLSTRRYGVGLKPVDERTEGTLERDSTSVVSRKFAALTEHALADLLAADPVPAGPRSADDR